MLDVISVWVNYSPDGVPVYELRCGDKQYGKRAQQGATRTRVRGAAPAFRS